jgi:hypothetical protein
VAILGFEGVYLQPTAAVPAAAGQRLSEHDLAFL